MGWKYFVGGWSDNSAASHAMSTKPSTKRRAKEESNGDKKQRFYFKFPENNSDFALWLSPWGLLCDSENTNVRLQLYLPC